MEPFFLKVGVKEPTKNKVAPLHITEFLDITNNMAVQTHFVHLVQAFCGVRLNNGPIPLPTLPKTPTTTAAGNTGFHIKTLTAQRTLNEGDWYEMQFLIAAERFNRWQKDKNKYKIVKIDVVLNPVLLAAFDKKQQEFKRNGIPHTTELGYHGTKGSVIVYL